MRTVIFFCLLGTTCLAYPNNDFGKDLEDIIKDVKGNVEKALSENSQTPKKNSDSDEKEVDILTTIGESLAKNMNKLVEAQGRLAGLNKTMKEELLKTILNSTFLNVTRKNGSDMNDQSDFTIEFDNGTQSATVADSAAAANYSHLFQIGMIILTGTILQYFAKVQSA